MKLQIISRLCKIQKPKYDSIRQIIAFNTHLNTQSVQQHQKMNEYYSVHTDGVNHLKEKPEKVDFRQFFNNFNTQCEVKYEPIDFKPQEIKRKLAPLLESKRCIKKLETTNQSKETSISTTLNEEDDLRQNYFYQKAKQKIRKVNSLIDLDHQQNCNRIESTRKPGFIKQNKSLKKKESSLHISKVQDTNKENINRNDNNRVSKYGKMSVEIDESKERITNIRKQLNEIYQMRNRQGQTKLRLN